MGVTFYTTQFYCVTLRHKGGQTTFETMAQSAEEAVNIILDLELAPRSSLVSVVCKRFAH